MNDIKITTLANGLRVATETMPGLETVSVGTWIGAGARNEQEPSNGVAHMLEHMVFKGTERRNAMAIAEEIEAVGGQMNAYTGRENTAYYVKLMKADLALGVDVIGDILQNSTFDAEEFERERQVILQEIGQAFDTPDDIVFDHFQLAAYPSQSLGRPVLGTIDTVGGMRRDTVLDYLRGHYAGPSMIAAAAGAVEHDRFVDLVSEHFGGLAAPVQTSLPRAVYGGGELREERDLEQAHIVLGFDGVGFHDPEFHAMSVLSTALGGGMSSRLFQEVREKRGLVYSIYSFTASYTDGGLFGVYAGTGPKDVPELIPVVCDEICRAAEDMTDAEVDRARAQLRAGVLMALETSMARCEQLAQQLLIYDRPVALAEILAKVDAVDTAAVRRAAKRLRQCKPTVAAIGPLSGLESYDSIVARLAA
jgi:predicted Zn-dependent peptidase